jgi:hypothetical protein
MFHKIVIVILILAIVFAVVIIGANFYNILLLEATPAPTTTTTSTITATYNASQQFEIEPGVSATLQIEIGSQNLSVKASNKVFQVFGIAFTPPAVSFTEACQIAYKIANLNALDEITLDYHSGKMVYTVTGYAKDSFYGLDVENFRVIRISDSGDVTSVNKELLFISFLKNLFSSTTKMWQY